MNASTPPPARTFPELPIVLVVPCFNEAARLDLKAFMSYLQEHPESGLLFVNDGSTDDTADVLRLIQARAPGQVQLLELPRNMGKAEAVRQGLLLALRSQRHYVGYWDADLSTPLSAVDHFLTVLNRRPEILLALGARVALLGRRVRHRLSRHSVDRLFAVAASLSLGLPVYDTQCGAKILRSDPHLTALLSEPFHSRWIFDVELLARYREAKLPNTGIYELVLDDWEDSARSKVSSADVVRAVRELAHVHLRYRVPARLRSVIHALLAPLARYGIISNSGTLVQYLVMAFLISLGLWPFIASPLGAVAGGFVHYTLNYYADFTPAVAARTRRLRFISECMLMALGHGAGMWLLQSQLSVPSLLAQPLLTVATMGLYMPIHRLHRVTAEQSPGAVTPEEIG